MSVKINKFMFSSWKPISHEIFRILYIIYKFVEMVDLFNVMWIIQKCYFPYASKNAQTIQMLQPPLKNVSVKRQQTIEYSLLCVSCMLKLIRETTAKSAFLVLFIFNTVPVRFMVSSVYLIYKIAKQNVFFCRKLFDLIARYSNP